MLYYINNKAKMCSPSYVEKTWSGHQQGFKTSIFFSALGVSEKFQLYVKELTSFQSTTT